MEDPVIHLEKAVRLMPQSADYCDNLGHVLAVKSSIAEALLRFEQAATLTGLQKPAILEMLAAKYSNTRPRFAGRRERTATQERNVHLGARLGAGLARQQSEKHQGTAQSVTR